MRWLGNSHSLSWSAGGGFWEGSGLIELISGDGKEEHLIYQSGDEFIRQMSADSIAMALVRCMIMVDCACFSCTLNFDFI